MKVNFSSSFPIIKDCDDGTQASGNPTTVRSETQTRKPTGITKPSLSTRSTLESLSRHPRMHDKLDGAYASANLIDSPTLSFADKPKGTIAFLAKGTCVVAPTAEDFSHHFNGLTICGTANQPLGAIATTAIDEPDMNCVALTWIEKEGNVPDGATDLTLWYMSKLTNRQNLEVRNILNEDLFSHLFKNYQMTIVDDDSLRGSVKEINAIAQKRLIDKGWILK